MKTCVRTRIIAAALACALFPALALAQGGGKEGGKSAARIQPVIAAPVKRAEFVDKIEALGTLRANETVTLTATVTEPVTAVNFEDGARVEKGDALVEMTSAEEAAELDAEQATVDEARRQVERLKPLVEKGAAAPSLLDERQRELDTAKARLAGVQSRISDRLIIAPFTGVVGLRNISVGTVVQPGMKITTLDDDSVMKLDFSVPAIYLPALKPGLEIVARTAAFGDREFRGKISSVDSQVDPQTRSIMARALIPNDERMLKPGLLMSVNLLKDPRTALVIPEEAIVPLGRRNYVFVVQDGDPATVRRQEIIIGARREGEVEVVDGLQEGLKIVTHGTMNVADGGAVSVESVDTGDESLREMLSPAQTEPASGKVD
jgi:membrane fusion protein (multidrug efflux system)